MDRYATKSNSQINPTQQKGITLLDPQFCPEILAASDDSEVYSDLTLQEALDCVNNYYGLCPHIGSYRSNYAKDCIISIYLDNMQNIHRYCDFLVYPNRKLESHIYNISPGKKIAFK